jgi:hypothetical protein
MEKESLVEKGTAEKRRKLYMQRHKSDIQKVNSNGFWASVLLW